jgi:two-component system cell cycle sensor histidine kinase/response regulator CckA
VRVAAAGPARGPAEMRVGDPWPASSVLATGRAVVVTDAGTDPRVAALADEGIRAALAVPVPGGRGVLAVLSVGFDAPRPLGAAEVSFASALAHVLAAAVERREAEDALRRSEEQLRQSQKMEAIGQLAGGVAHDFNNLLTAIVGYAELMTMRLTSGDPLLRDVGEIRKAADRAAGLTRQLLAFGRKQLLAPKVVDLNAIVTHMENLLRRVIGEDIRLVSRLAPALRPVRVDPGRVEQVILNLAVNARDAMPDGGSLTVETENVEIEHAGDHDGLQPGRYVLLSVTDTGTGMDESVRSRVFEPFFTTKEQGKGTGLGLSTVYGIVRQSGGHVSVESEPGKGACFRVWLPQEQAAAGLAGGEPSAEPGRASTGSETVLVVEDEHTVRELARHVLELHGYRVLDAKDAFDALAVATAHPGRIDLLVTDIVMPGTSGPELAEQLKELRPELSVLFVSGYTSHAAVQGRTLVSGSDFLQKPFTPADLARAVRAVLDQSLERARAAETG